MQGFPATKTLQTLQSVVQLHVKTHGFSTTQTLQTLQSVVQLHVNMHGFTATETVQTLQSVVQLHVKMHGFTQTCLQTLCSTPCKHAWIPTNMLTNPMFNCM